jgi:hypothetical protein
MNERERERERANGVEAQYNLHAKWHKLTSQQEGRLHDMPILK